MKWFREEFKIDEFFIRIMLRVVWYVIVLNIFAC